MNALIRFTSRGLAVLALVGLCQTGLAQTYIGEVCWRLDIDDQNETEFMRLGVTEAGDGHYTVSGYTFQSQDDMPSDHTVLNGAAELFGDTIVISMNGTYKELDEFVSVAVHATVSAATLNGTVTILGDFVENEGTGTEAGGGTLTVSVCP